MHLFDLFTLVLSLSHESQIPLPEIVRLLLADPLCLSLSVIHYRLKGQLRSLRVQSIIDHLDPFIFFFLKKLFFTSQKI